MCKLRLIYGVKAVSIQTSQFLLNAEAGIYLFNHTLISRSVSIAFEA